MFGRLANDRIRSATQALDEGRLDDAFRLLSSQKGRPPAEAESLLARLAEALMTRGQERLLSRRFTEALADFDHAASCGVDEARVEPWRARARSAMKEAHAADEQARAAAAESLATELLPKAMEAFLNGRLAQARSLVQLVAGAAPMNAERSTLESALQLAKQASQALHGDRFAEARVLVGRIAQLGLAADWLTDCQARLDSLQECRQSLLSGPLGLISDGRMPVGITMTPDDAPRHPVHATAAAPGAAPPVHPAANSLRIESPGNGLPRRLVLRIDGVGTFLLLRGDRVTIGRAGPGASADLELFADLSERQAQIIRSGEDYFIAGVHGVELAGRKVEHALLQHDDRIRLGSRVKLRYLRPSSKSVTSMLDLGEGIRTTCESRRVVLWGGPLIMAHSRDAHVVLPGGTGGVVLLERDGQILAKPMSGRETPRTVALGSPFVIGDLRLSIAALDRSASPGRVVG